MEFPTKEPKGPVALEMLRPNVVRPGRELGGSGMLKR